jgi:hypothetical protein
MKYRTATFFRSTMIAFSLSISSIWADDELSPALSLKLSGCVFTLDQFVNNVGSDGTPVSEAYRIYLLSGFSFEDVIFLKKDDQWEVYWRSGIRKNVDTDFSNLPLFKRRFNSEIAAKLLDSVAAPGLWKGQHHDPGDEGDDGFRAVAAKWSNGVTVFKTFRTKTNTKELADAAALAVQFWRFFETNDTDTKTK